MADAQVQKRIANTRAGMHMKALEELQKRLSNEPDRACYGPKEVRRAFEFQAIDTLMISDELFRNQESLQVRQEYVKLVEEVKALGGCTVYVFSSGHVTGQALAKLAGIAAMQKSDEMIMKKKGIMICVDTTSIHNQGL